MTKDNSERAEGLVERLWKHRYSLPENFYSDADYGCNEDDPLAMIMCILDSGPQGIHVMEELTVYDFTIVETPALEEAVARITALEAENAKLREALEPFAAFADPRGNIPATHVLTAGSAMARHQLTMGDCYRARAALEPSHEGENTDG